MSLPHCETLLLEPVEGVLRITLNRPQSRNAMSLAMVGELRAVLAAVRDDRSVRALVLRGAGGHFCAGGDIKDMAGARAAGAEAYRTLNRAFGSLLEEAQAAPQLLVALVEGAVLGGGFGLACVSDVAIAAADAQFGLPETSLGILPAQIAPFVVRRIGLTQARRLALTAARFDGREALRLGLVHFCEAAADALEQRLEETLEQLRRCAPNANAATKALLLASESGELGALLDDAARQFAEAVGGAEGSEGTLAFVQKRKPVWAQ
ncbi:isohexenylglutaconyl-CoA hydratase [Pseudomonas aeruginosa]|nr:isohexenylglutaconyl-CoA hydratase [Pseudomonas aeruginosa]